MKIQKGTLVLVEKSAMPYLGLVDKKVADDTHFLLKNNRRRFSEDDVIPLLQTNPKKIRTVNQAIKVHHRLIIKRLLEEI